MYILCSQLYSTPGGSYEYIFVTSRGGVYMRQGPLSPPHPDSLPPAWIQLDGAPLEGDAVFTKVHVGPSNHMVWALDSHRRVYVREAIYPELPIGLAWVHVPGLTARQLSVSDAFVHALTPSGRLFRRTGITRTNSLGERWELVPGALSLVSCSSDNRLWGVDTQGRLCYHATAAPNEACPDAALQTPHALAMDQSESDGWEVL